MELKEYSPSAKLYQAFVSEEMKALNAATETILKGGEIYDSILGRLPSITEAHFTMTSLDIAIIDGTKDDLIQCVKVLRSHKFIPDERPKENDVSWYTLWRRNEGDGPEILIWFSFSSSQCRRVQVGTKTVEQPIYEVECSSNEKLNDIDLEI